MLIEKLDKINISISEHLIFYVFTCKGLLYASFHGINKK